MKKVILSIAILTFMAACGGGSSKQGSASATEEASVQETTISDEESLEAEALHETTDKTLEQIDSLLQNF